MEVLRHLRSLGLVVLGVALALSALAPAAGAQRRGRAEPTAAPAPQWPVKTREHVDLWLHGFALLQDDTATVPLFSRGYAERLTVLKNSRGLLTMLDTARASLAAHLEARPQLLGAQFVALHFGSWEEMTRAFEFLARADREPNRAVSLEVRAVIDLLTQYFPRPVDRDFARRFVAALQDERTVFHHEWWLAESRGRERALAAVDSLWQRRWRPPLQRYLNHTQQASGDLVLALTLGGEGRAIPAGKNANQYAVTWPATPDSAETLLFAFAHEVAGTIAQVAVDDNLTPAQKRAGAGAPIVSAGLVRGGALLVERVEPGMGERYARWYLAQMGRPAPEGTALDALAAAFPMPEEMLASMRRQIDIAFAGI
jgi:hypothetical protein